jgi:two-component system, NtrC family, response regulator AtoC
VLENSIRIARLLVISRDSAVLSPLWSAAGVNGWQIDVAGDIWGAMDKVQTDIALDLLVLDLPKGNGDGLQILRTLRRMRPALPIVLIGHPGDDSRQQESMQMGARDYLIRPLEESQFERTIRQNLERTAEGMQSEIASEDVEQVGNDGFFIGISPLMRKLRSQVALLAEVDVPVFISGESGSGKNTIARLLHTLSVRSGFPFAKIDCTALPKDLLEQEIFGCEAGGASVSSGQKAGKLELCAKGMIFLDEITEMPLTLQSKFTQVLQSGRFIKNDGSESVNVDVRLVAASSMSIDQAVSERRLLTDLSRQLSAYELRVPPLRARKSEIPVLSHHFMHRLARHYGLPPRVFAPAVCEAWQAHEWPGNLRELEQSVKRYLVVGEKVLGFPKKLPDGEDETQDAASMTSVWSSRGPALSRQPGGICGHKSLRSLLQSVKEEAERSAIALALEKTGWNRKAAARLLKTSYRTVLYKIEQYRLTATDSPSVQMANGFGSRKVKSRDDDNPEERVQTLSENSGGWDI